MDILYFTVTVALTLSRRPLTCHMCAMMGIALISSNTSPPSRIMITDNMIFFPELKERTSRSERTSDARSNIYLSKQEFFNLFIIAFLIATIMPATT
jgi:hypothetical protein